MSQAYISLGNPDKAVGAQEVVTQVDPTQQTFPNLALLAYQAGQPRKGDLAAAKAVEPRAQGRAEGPQGPARPAKSQAALQQIQQAAADPHADRRASPLRRYPVRPQPL